MIEKLVDIVHFLDLEIYDAFGHAGIDPYGCCLTRVNVVASNYGDLKDHIYALP